MQGGWARVRLSQRSCVEPPAADLEPPSADSCRAPPGTVVLDSQGKEIVRGQTTYPYAGLPLPQEGLLLFRA